MSLSQWDTLTPLVFRDLCSLDTDCRYAVLRGLPSFPLELLVAKELKAPGQIWVGGTKDEPTPVHIAALAALSTMLFRQEFFQMAALARDSWDFVADRAVDRSGATFCPAIAIVSNLFAYASGFRKYDRPDLLAPVAAHVAETLAPHLGWIVDQVCAVPDLAKPPCLYAITCLMTNVTSSTTTKKRYSESSFMLYIYMYIYYIGPVS